MDNSLSSRPIIAGRCSVCLKRQPLTQDHIFPQCISVPGQKRISDLLTALAISDKKSSRTHLAQNGLKKKTVCADCNNRILGTEYDPALKIFCDQVAVSLRNLVYYFGNRVEVKEIQLNKVMRSVVGHILASDDYPSFKGKYFKALRRYLLDPTAMFPEDLRAYVWLYPGRDQAVLKNMMIHRMSFPEPMWVNVYRTYPVGFAICSDIQHQLYKGMLEFSDKLTAEITQCFSLRFPSKVYVPLAWPETPAADGMVFMGRNSGQVATPYKKTKPYPY